MDSLLLNYNFSKGANENLLAKTEKNENYLRREMEKFQKSVLEYQQKAQTGAFLSRESEMKQGEQLKRKQQELENMQERMTKELLTEQNKLNEQLKDSINAFMEEYNKTRNYEIIFSNAMNNNVLYAKKGYNITAEVIELLNARYPAAE